MRQDEHARRPTAVRRERLAEELRANLAKRKSQARARARAERAQSSEPSKSEKPDE